MITLTRTDCAVVGAGPSGLLLAVLLARAGWAVEVLERDSVLRPPPGGVVLQPATLGVLRQLGVLGALRSAGQVIDGVEETGPGGPLFAADYRRLPGVPLPWALAVPLRAIREALLGLAGAEPRVTLRTGAVVAGLRDQPPADCELDVSTDAGPGVLRAGWVVGADGKHSTVRRLARFTADVRPFPHRQLIARAPRPARWPPRIRSHRAGRPLVVIPTGPAAVHVFGDVTVAGAAPAGAALAELAEAVGACYPALAGPLRAHGEQVALIRHHTIQVDSWHRGRVMLLGDSVHSVHPYGGQGINLALQDALLAAAALDTALRAGEPAALAKFEARRRPFVERFQARQRDLLSTRPAAEALYLAGFAELALGQQELRPLLLQPAALPVAPPARASAAAVTQKGSS